MIASTPPSRPITTTVEALEKGREATLVEAVDEPGRIMHHCGFAQEILPILERLAAYVSQEHCRYSDEVGAPQAGCVEGEAEHLRAEFVPMPYAIAETNSVQVPDWRAVDDLAEQ